MREERIERQLKKVNQEWLKSKMEKTQIYAYALAYAKQRAKDTKACLDKAYEKNAGKKVLDKFEQELTEANKDVDFLNAEYAMQLQLHTKKI